VAILTVIAFPSYQEHTRKGHRSTAQTFLLDIASRQEQYLNDARAYATGSGALGTLNLTVPTDVSKYYTVTVGPDAPTLPPTYTITATPIAGTQQASDGALTLDNTGAKTRGGASGW
jgi:type IV pilus assembly protein PilE